MNYLVVYICEGVVNDHGFVTGRAAAETAVRDWCEMEEDAPLTEHGDGTLSLSDEVDLDAWAFALPETLPLAHTTGHSEVRPNAAPWERHFAALVENLTVCGLGASHV